ncbi:50S ribosomal protein L6 [Candidatus Daviesbacteria bacterium RIFCSPLOWO2_02_FULL_41_8]|uniref:Large ribosomal subunit protein uL6 n=3 Tax=Candidatus Daviesiibacteriota TaxID=1752718 RepID=A0A1F5NLR7_9BACT|nr:MAG: 50S ribosomal protein L6 [Candidatus Daviesbacteria bacterium RIFCSPHIGHO2_01_FULL_41_23]OGE32798.1 MAG: 50S ribosomal protein L6 [Candidatus Daviesbacteria bacterium RIFCSPHIGHO2_02_FULL_41_10]OGE62140.1 MAG: 50S ribosomal protein L6 [Candidatus Daviesbacteria bacterium RIFCSPLOWO2_01_FULL_41_32]OGE78621.1 MAG: 50S ribosomal protein L6 [Candidatus Daviesbacteria bacterium RIFCSPLOWO2_02_FULL_41_8]
MSRIGNAVILIPVGTEVSKTGQQISVTGPKGTLEIDVDPAVSVEIEGGQVTVKRKNDQKKVRALHGLTRSLIANMIMGVNTLWIKDLELVGVGFRAQVTGDKLILNVGYSHQVEIVAPAGVVFEVVDNTKIKVSGIDKQLVGQVAANLRKVREPDVYKGKGIRYAGEYIRKKVGKSAKVGVAAGAGSK